MKTVSLKIPNTMSKETAEFLLNIKSYLLIKPKLTYPMICYNAKRKVCKDCEQPECDLAKGLWRRKKVEAKK
jgi:hypothetical protein